MPRSLPGAEVYVRGEKTILLAVRVISTPILPFNGRRQKVNYCNIVSRYYYRRFSVESCSFALAWQNGRCSPLLFTQRLGNERIRKRLSQRNAGLPPRSGPVSTPAGASSRQTHIEQQSISHTGSKCYVPQTVGTASS